MWFFRKKGEEFESKIDRLDSALETSFQKVRTDMESVRTGMHSVNQWISYLYSQDLERQRLIDIIHSQMNQLSQTRINAPQMPEMSHYDEKIRHMESKIDSIKDSVRDIEPVARSIVPVSEKVAVLGERIAGFEESHKAVFEKLKELSSRIESRSESVQKVRHSSSLREKIVRKVARRSKEYTKGIILSAIARYEDISALQLREMIVDEQGLCSKSTFYRLLEEIEYEGSADMVSRGKEKFYMPKMEQAKH